MCKTGKQILIVEDTKTVSMLLSATLKREGFLVDVADSIQAARRFLDRKETCQLKYDLVLVDINLPDGDGSELLRELAASSWCNARYAVSADASRGARRQALAAGADKYITKPFDLRALINTISEEIGCRKIIRHNLTAEDWADEKKRLAQGFRNHLVFVSEELKKPMSFKALKCQLHQLRGSAMLYGFKRISVLASELSERLTSQGPSRAEDVRDVLRQEIRVSLKE